MKAGLLGVLLGGAIAVAVVTGSSCTVERPSKSLECASQADCAEHPGTICQSGYCIRGTLPVDAKPADAFVCPAVCNGGCDMSTSTPVCTITGTGSPVTCPAGMRCAITCGQPGACSQVDCRGASSCDIECLADVACGTVTCDTKDCNVTCTGNAACGMISCTTGNCTAACTGPNACGSITCAGGDCTATCSGGSNACGSVNCGSGKCSATCEGIDPACGTVHCASSCQCDIDCDMEGNTCPLSMACPDPNGGQVDECEDDFGRCDSSETPNRCRKCM